MRLLWTGNEGAGTATHDGYARAHRIEADNKTPLEGSSDPAFRGDPSRWNPEELLLASIAACHQLWFLGLCAGAGIVVTAYEDAAEATMLEQADCAGQFTEALHAVAHAKCFIARSVNFPVRVAPRSRFDPDPNPAPG